MITDGGCCSFAGTSADKLSSRPPYNPSQLLSQREHICQNEGDVISHHSTSLAIMPAQITAYLDCGMYNDLHAHPRRIT